MSAVFRVSLLAIGLASLLGAGAASAGRVTIELSEHSTGPPTLLDVSELFQCPAQLSLIDEAPLK